MGSEDFELRCTNRLVLIIVWSQGWKLQKYKRAPKAFTIFNLWGDRNQSVTEQNHLLKSVKD